MTEPEIIAALRLQAIPNIGDITAKKLIAHCGESKLQFLRINCSHLLKIEGIGQLTLKGLHRFNPFGRSRSRVPLYYSTTRLPFTYFEGRGLPYLFKTLY